LHASGQIANGLGQGVDALVLDRLTSATSDWLREQINRPRGVFFRFFEGRPRCVAGHVVLSHS
jgi:hypothetical protein